MPKQSQDFSARKAPKTFGSRAGVLYSPAATAASRPGEERR